MASTEITPGRTLKERLFGNPVALKELRGRMRGARAFMVLTIYLALMGGFVTLVYLLYSTSRVILGPSQGGEIGRVLFISIVGVELFLVTFIAPAFAAGAISGERERQTYDMLRTTLLPARTLVNGKLVATLSYIFLLLLAAIPLQSVAFLFGGVTELEIILSFVILVVTAILLGTVGVFFSATTSRTLSASVLSYGFALMTVLVLPVAFLVLAPTFSTTLSLYGASISPVAETLIYYGVGLLIATNPMATLIATLFLLIDRQEIGFFSIQLVSNGQSIPLVSPWIVFVLLSLVVSAVLVVLTVRRVNRIEDV
ncbi:MAG: ABC transporter permease [Anaerolineae bacterium]|nr:ABC transporter permease [Anaerolineae bacterium]